LGIPSVVGRRSILIGGVAAAAVAGVGWRAWDRGVGESGEGQAYQPWRDWEGRPDEALLRPVRAAILAANPHDTQPWIFAVGTDAVEVFADRARNLGSFDPFRREMHLGLGAAIENLAIAARADGFAVEVAPVEGRLALSPVGAPFRAARVSFLPAPGERSGLYAAIPLRHTNRGPYRPETLIPLRVLERLAGLASRPEVLMAFVTDPGARRDLGALIVEATERIADDPDMSSDSARWFRVDRREIEAHRDGVTLDAAGLSPAMTALAKLMPDMSAKSNDAYWLSMTRDVQLPTAPALGIVFVRDRLDMRGAIEAGRTWQRLHLAATAQSLAAQPLNQPVERVDRDAALGRPDAFGKALAGFAPAPGWEATFVFRLGLAERPASASPRRAITDVTRLTA
jgi:hypothetical protein